MLKLKTGNVVFNVYPLMRLHLSPTISLPKKCMICNYLHPKMNTVRKIRVKQRRGGKESEFNTPKTQNQTIGFLVQTCTQQSLIGDI